MSDTVEILNQKLREADAYFIHGHNPALLDDTATQITLVQAAKDGKPLVVQTSANSPSISKSLLEPFGIEPLDYNIVDINRERARANPYLLEIDGEEGAFSNPHLFSGVDRVVISGAGVIRRSKWALPQIRVNRNRMLVDRRTDDKVDWERDNETCMVLYKEPRSGCVLGYSGGLFHDYYVGPTGLEFPGIEANKQLATNLLLYLRDIVFAGIRIEGNEYVQRIEDSLYQFVRSVLERGDPYWLTTKINSDIRADCERKRQQDGSAIDANFDLVHYAAIIKDNWALFQQYFERARPSVALTSSKAIKFIHKLNVLRRPYSHRTKAKVTEFKPTAQDLSFLRETDELAMRLLSLARRG